jgi:hypothetical protein
VYGRKKCKSLLYGFLQPFAALHAIYVNKVWLFGTFSWHFADLHGQSVAICSLCSFLLAFVALHAIYVDKV